MTTSVVSGLVGHAPKRTVPAVTFSGAFQCLGLVNDSANIDTLSAFSHTDRGFEIRVVLLTSVSIGDVGLFRTHNDAAAFAQSRQSTNSIGPEAGQGVPKDAMGWASSSLTTSSSQSGRSWTSPQILRPRPSTVSVGRSDR